MSVICRTWLVLADRLVGVSGTVAWGSTAPMAQGPVGRATPRWSVSPAPQVAASRAGLPAPVSIVQVGPPLSFSVPSRGSSVSGLPLQTALGTAYTPPQPPCTKLPSRTVVPLFPSRNICAPRLPVVLPQKTDAVMVAWALPLLAIAPPRLVAVLP